MLKEIRELEKIARTLEPTPAQRKDLQHDVLAYGENFLDHIYDIPAYVATEDKGRGIYDSPISDAPIGIDDAIRLIRHNIDRPGLNPASGGHLGYIPGGGIYASALGDYLADVTNRFAGVYFAGPGAVRMEGMLVNWMANEAGYPDTAGGNLTSGGSMANLIGIVAARDAHALHPRDFEKAVIYLTSQTHHSVDKAIRIAGLKESAIRYVPVDTHYRMNADALEQQIAADEKAGLLPFLIIASAGTTDVGAVDPLDAIASIAAAHKAWFHVDGAYGAFFILTKHGKRIMHGIERSDSLVMDPHKGLFLPYGTGAILVRSQKDLYNSYWYQAGYLQDALKNADELSPADLSPELTKHFRGMRMWLPLKLYGVAPFRAALEEKLLLARYFREEIQRVEGFVVGPEPDLSVVTYRYIPKKGDPNVFNERLVQEIHNDGRVFISSTMLNGNHTLRLAVLCFRTHVQTMDLALQVLREKAEMIAAM